MSLDSPKAGARIERLTALEALQRLEHERDSRLTQLRAIDERGQGAGEHVTSLQKETIRRVLTQIEAAFASVQDGSYGLCRNCAKPIPVERLEILPYAPFCVPCQRSAT